MRRKSVKKKIMNEKEMMEFIVGVGRSELWDEIEDRCNRMICMDGKPYPRYIKAVKVTLIELGYDTHWVETTFREALEKYYLDET